MKKLGLATVALSVLLLSGCGGGGSSSSKNADIVIDNVSTLDIGKVFIKKSSNAEYENILTQIIKSNTEVALSTKICDTNIDIKIVATDGISHVNFKNQNLPCGQTLFLQAQ